MLLESHYAVVEQRDEHGRVSCFRGLNGSHAELDAHGKASRSPMSRRGAPKGATGHLRQAHVHDVEGTGSQRLAFHFRNGGRARRRRCLLLLLLLHDYYY